LLTNYFIPPHPSLSTFVDNYILSTSGNDSITFKGYWPASNETSLIFYMRDSTHHHQNDHSASILPGKKNCVVGLLTRCNGIVNFTGKYHTFIIQFKANGFNKIFRLPMYEFTDKIFVTEDVFGKQAKYLYQQLLNAKDIFQMAQFADAFLLSFFNYKRAITDDGITAIAEELYNTTALLSVSQYAYKANMSIRNFERRFIDEVGISPKLYARITRFYNALENKMLHPRKNWTDIVYENGYYDQSHFIKEFKAFTGTTPSGYSINNSPVTLATAQQPEEVSPALV